MTDDDDQVDEREPWEIPLPSPRPDFRVDVLPAKHGITAEFREIVSDLEYEIRFQAFRMRDHPTAGVNAVDLVEWDDDAGARSAWSGWFTYTGEPIVITWAAFEWPA